MQRPDDVTLTPNQWLRVRKEAERALREAGALGTLPTPMSKIMEVSHVIEVKEDVLNPRFVERMRAEAEKIGRAVKRAVTKVVGLFHASDGLVFLNQALIAVRKRFVGFHECAHGFLKWQRPMYAVVEDCDKSLDGETAELFDREANVFASEVLFQLDTFRDMAESERFSIWTPVNLARKFQASNYAAIRQYVAKNHRACAVLVLDMPEIVVGAGFRAQLRRVIQSPSFTELFRNITWPEAYTPDDKLGALVPMGTRRASRPRSIGLTDSNGLMHDCIAESFTTRHHVFILVRVAKPLSTTHIILAGA